ncbi:response regulator transcription factor [Flammeovirga sp. MY04]|uniref:response regulator transcription factor n=1 Tax=Flammeovirga sp. MY04 TaxID=1191459 RepID=UPI0008062C7C|nr:response regulator transcription factor [Flammeovirga sp. MY04]ANQ52325.1 response regulator transcription factor [Flammeovirga sp. MY04]
MEKLKILIVDDHVLFCTGIEQILKNLLNADVEVCFDPKETLEKYDLNKYQIILVDMDMPEMKGFEFIERAKEKTVDTKYLIVSMHSKPSILRKANRLNIDGYILKDDDMTTFTEAITTITNGGQYFTSKLNGVMSVQSIEKTVVSPREEQIIRMVAEGKSMKTISEILFISHETVKTHTKNIRAKLQIDSKADLIKYAVENLLI